jgi:hypothetical protein
MHVPNKVRLQRIGSPAFFSWGQNLLHAQVTLMVGENKDDRTGEPFKMFLEEALTQQMNLYLR